MKRGEERRQYRRVHVSGEVNWFSGSNFYSGFTHDLSQGGVFIVSYQQLQPPGTEVTIELGLVGGAEIKARGVVRWVRDPQHLDDDSEPPGMGIQFLDLTAEDEELIQTFVDHRDPMFYTE